MKAVTSVDGVELFAAAVLVKAELIAPVPL